MCLKQLKTWAWFILFVSLSCYGFSGSLSQSVVSTANYLAQSANQLTNGISVDNATTGLGLQTLGDYDALMNQQRVLQQKIELQKLQDQLNQSNKTPSMDNRSVLPPIPDNMPHSSSTPPSMSSESKSAYLPYVALVSGWNGHWMARLVFSDQTVLDVQVGDDLVDGYSVCRINHRGVWYKGHKEKDCVRKLPMSPSGMRHD